MESLPVGPAPQRVGPTTAYFRAHLLYSIFRAKPIQKSVICCDTKSYKKLGCFIQDAESRFHCPLSTHLMLHLIPISRLYNSLEQMRQKGRSALKQHRVHGVSLTLAWFMSGEADRRHNTYVRADPAEPTRQRLRNVSNISIERPYCIPEPRLAKAACLGLQAKGPKLPALDSHRPD